MATLNVKNLPMQQHDFDLHFSPARGDLQPLDQSSTLLLSELE